MSFTCERCGIGRRDFDGICDWCAAPSRARLPFWILFRRWLERSPLAAELRRSGPVATGVAVGVILHLLAAAVGVAFGLTWLWQSGFLWSQQWWWALVSERWQPWLFAALRGIAYGALAGWVAAAQTGGRGDGETGRWGPFSPSPRPLVSPSPATVTALAAFVVSGWDADAGTEYRLVAAALAAAVGQMTTLIVRGQKL